MSNFRMLAAGLLMPSLIVSTTAFGGSGMDQATVVDVEPVYRTVDYTVPSEQCRLVEVPVAHEPQRHGYRSYTGPIVGAIIGGAIGNAVGHNKTNKKVGTAVGAVLGGTIGRDVQHRHRQQRMETRHVTYRTEEVCETVHETRERLELDGYDVTWRYGGQTHTTRMDTDPGEYLPVRVHVTPV
jgi:uncharacterized protein YcfJ